MITDQYTDQNKPFYSAASSKSLWRGYDYYLDKKIIDIKKINNFEYAGKAKGSNENIYTVQINLKKPATSKCDCPHAKDKRIICKHKVALYFTIFPEQASQFIANVEEVNRRYEDYQEKLYLNTEKKIKNMKKTELQECLNYILEQSPEWLYDKFINAFIINDDSL